MFSRCCENRSIKEYALTHDPKPISFSEDMGITIKKLLWYAPNIDSYQAIRNELIEDKAYDDFSFTYIMNRMGMDENRDVKWLDPKDCIDEDDWSYYSNSICCNCQKIIIVRCKSLSKTNDLLRCIRNCIAHGQFAIVDDFIIGFNTYSTKNNPEGDKKQ